MARGAGLITASPASAARGPSGTRLDRPRGRQEDRAITANASTARASVAKSTSWSYAEHFVPESEAMERARARASELGIGATGPGAGSLLRALCAAADARSVVEVGTGAGVSGLWLLGGMPADGVLTTIDVEVEHLRAARQAFAEVGVRSGRIRGITGRASDVLPRLTEGGYDLVLLDADPRGALGYLDRAVRLLRRGGVLAVAGALSHDRAGDPAQRDPATTAVREIAKELRAQEDLLPSLVPSSDGLLLAVRRR
ncbi:O-methyltransferase [Quadrisphaera sp. DSM 44207]|uniref:O-methyltransferase n=1 Tax=Quadrisphaera sp. DSM 44207 TaxID=1881057 RepID=UPI000886A492|nr:O-methyltransferase [Quadrisphaera sp. DSM 44207]SDQ71513.1 Predicted O-methyltransferase YrrM [Quadrisphaera sp. DSM 44207]